MYYFFPVVNEYDYVFSENGLVAYKEGKQIGQEVRRVPDSAVGRAPDWRFRGSGFKSLSGSSLFLLSRYLRLMISLCIKTKGKGYKFDKICSLMWHLTKNIFSNIFFKIWPKMTNVKKRISPMYSGLPVVTT